MKANSDLIKSAENRYHYNEENHKKDIEYSISNTTVYSPDNRFVEPYRDFDTEVTMALVTTTGGLREINKWDDHGKIALLNFASYKYPGGYFLGGSSAQEEFLCHESTLYNVLESFNTTYYADYTIKEKPTEEEIEVTDIKLFDGDNFILQDKIKADVITCAAPNWGAFSRHSENIHQFNSVLKDRIRFVLNIAADQQENSIYTSHFFSIVYCLTLQNYTKISRK